MARCVSSDLDWLLTPDGKSFFFTSDWFRKQTPSCNWVNPRPAHDPLASLGALYRQQLLHNGFLNLTASPKNSDLALAEFSMVQEVAGKTRVVSESSGDLEGDDVARWWALIGQLACLVEREEKDAKVTEIYGQVALLPSGKSEELMK